MSRPKSILIVDDDTALTGALSETLQGQDYAVRVAGDVPSGRAALRDEAPDLCLVDIMMPGPSGRVFCREVVDRSDIPVIMMSSLSDSETVIALLELGADDYIVKPFQMGEMLARIRPCCDDSRKRRSGPFRGCALVPGGLSRKNGACVTRMAFRSP